MVAAQLAGLMKVGGVFAVALLSVAINPTSNTVLSGAPQKAINDLMLAFSNTGEFLYIFDSEDNYSDKSSDLNIQIVGEAIEGTNQPIAIDEGELTLVEIVQNLNEAGFLTGEAYRSALREVEQGIIQVRSELLSLVEVQSRPEPDASESILPRRIAVYDPDERGISLPRIPVAINDGGLTEEQIQTLMEQFEELGISANRIPNLQTAEQMQEILDRLNETGILSEQAYTALQNSIATTRVHVESQLYQDAVRQMRLDEALDPVLVEPQLGQ